MTTNKITSSSKWEITDSLDDARLNKKQGRYKRKINEKSLTIITKLLSNQLINTTGFIVHRLGWVAGRSDKNRWIQVEFSKPLQVTAIQTQQRAYRDHRTTKYKISYSNDGVSWTVYINNDGSEKVSS